MSGHNNIEILISLLKKSSIAAELKDLGINIEYISEIIKYLQFLAIKMKIYDSENSINLKYIKKIRELGNKISLLENQLYELWKNSDEELKENFIIALGIIATLFDFIGRINSDEDYLIKSAILYSISEYESNSYIIIDRFIEHNPKFKKLINFDYRSEIIEPINYIDLIILLNILFFSRHFIIIDKFLERNREFLEENKYFHDWVLLFENIMLFVNSGIEKEKILTIFKKIMENKLKYENPLLIWIINRLNLHFPMFFNNSIWVIKEKLEHIPNEYIQELINSKIYELWKSQRDCIESISKFGKNNILLMPTSSGKTLIAEIQTVYHIFNKNKKVLYICPTNALANQIYHEHLIRFLRISINSLRITGSYEQTYEIDEFLFINSSFIIMTPEKFDLLWRNNQEKFLNSFSLIIFDEFQLIEDRRRGLKYELLISRLNNIIKLKNLDLSLTFLSACIPHSVISPVLKWLGSDRTLEVGIKWKPTRTIEGILLDDSKNEKIHGIVFPNLNDYKIKDIFPQISFRTIDDKILFFIKYLSNFYPIMIFYENKKGTERIIQKIYDKREYFGLNKNQDTFFTNQLNIIKDELGCESNLLKFLKYGLVFHHSGLPEGIREIIEYLIREGFIKIFACTTTFAEGVNLPVHLIVFHSLNLYYEEINSTDLISFRLYENIIGRAGRALKFSEGLVLIPDKDAIAFNFINSDLEPLKSMFEFLKDDLLQEKFEILLNNKLISDLQVDLLSFEKISDLKAEDYLKNTLYFQNNKKISSGIIRHFEKQKRYINDFEYPSNTEKIFKNSGLNLLFCKNLYDYIILNNFHSKFSKYDIKSLINSKEFEDINEWIFSNHPDLSQYDKSYCNIIKIWINRDEMNYEKIFSYCNYDDEKFFEIIRFLNQKIRYIFPWIWSIIIKLLFLLNPKLIKFKFIPYFLKFGLNSKEKLINFIYEANKEITIENKKLSKDQISNLLS